MKEVMDTECLSLHIGQILYWDWIPLAACFYGSTNCSAIRCITLHIINVFSKKFNFNFLIK